MPTTAGCLDLLEVFVESTLGFDSRNVVHSSSDASVVDLEEQIGKFGQNYIDRLVALDDEPIFAL
jgi:hypothetical protein